MLIFFIGKEFDEKRSKRRKKKRKIADLFLQNHIIDFNETFFSFTKKFQHSIEFGTYTWNGIEKVKSERCTEIVLLFFQGWSLGMLGISLFRNTKFIFALKLGILNQSTSSSNEKNELSIAVFSKNMTNLGCFKFHQGSNFFSE